MSDLTMRKEMRSRFSSCADSSWLTAGSHLTQLVNDGEMQERRRRKKNIHTTCALPWQRCPSLSRTLDQRWWQPWLRKQSDEDSIKDAPACWTSDCAWLNEAECYWPWQGRAWKRKSSLKLESVEGRILHRRCNMSQSPSVTRESNSLCVYFIRFFFQLPPLSDEPRAQPPPPQFFPSFSQKKRGKRSRNILRCRHPPHPARHYRRISPLSSSFLVALAAVLHLIGNLK